MTPHSLDQLLEVKQALETPIAAGERLYMLEEFQRLTSLRACDVVQMEIVLCLFPHEGNFFTEANTRSDAQEGHVSCKAGCADRCGKPESEQQIQEAWMSVAAHIRSIDDWN